MVFFWNDRMELHSMVPRYQFRELFDKPVGLPPKRALGHRIILKDNADLPNIQPYRYHHIQKGKIERLVTDMSLWELLGQTVVVLKHGLTGENGSWQFCVDCRTLNQAIIHDKFSNPMIDELPD